MSDRIVLTREAHHASNDPDAGGNDYFLRRVALFMADVCPLDDRHMKNHIEQIKRKVDELEEAEVLIPIGRPRKTLTLDEIENKARRQANRARKDRPRSTTEPWRCSKCGGWIEIDFCLKCEPWNGWY